MISGRGQHKCSLHSTFTSRRALERVAKVSLQFFIALNSGLEVMWALKNGIAPTKCEKKLEKSAQVPKFSQAMSQDMIYERLMVPKVSRKLTTDRIVEPGAGKSRYLGVTNSTIASAALLHHLYAVLTFNGGKWLRVTHPAVIALFIFPLICSMPLSATLLNKRWYIYVYNIYIYLVRIYIYTYTYRYIIEKEAFTRRSWKEHEGTIIDGENSKESKDMRATYMYVSGLCSEIYTARIALWTISCQHLHCQGGMSSLPPLNMF